MESPRTRRFPFLGGWSVVLLPLDLFPSRTVARVFFGTMYGFKPEDLIDLRARRLTLEDDEQERVWWVIAVTPQALRRSESRARAKRRQEARREGRRE